MKPSLRSIAIGAVALGAAVLTPQAASAAVSCSFGTHYVTVKLDAAGDHAKIVANADGTISVGGAPCGAANVFNTDSINIHDDSNSGTKVELDGSQAHFGPGFHYEGLGSSEIEINGYLGDGDDTLIVDGHKSGASIVFGKLGVNLNSAAEAFGQDPDVTVTGAEYVMVNGSSAADWISGQGGAGTGQPSTQAAWLYGRGGDDELHGNAGPFPTLLDGDAGDDVLVSGANGGQFVGGPGKDTLTGGSGYDYASYSQASGGVNVDLAITGPQDTGGAGVDAITSVESLTGSDRDDVLKGSAGIDFVSGRSGNDLIDGGDGSDRLFGGAGSDTLRTGLGDDWLDGSSGDDTLSYSGAPGPVYVDLKIGGTAQDTGATGKQRLDSIENLLGSPFADRLTGSAGPNAIDGGAGTDTINGGEGPDRLGGGAGLDTIDSRDASADSVSCGEGPDALAVDGLDTVAPDCAPAAPGEGPGGPGGGPGEPGGPGPAAPVLSVDVPRQSLRAVRKRGLRVVLSCSTDCRAAGGVVAARKTARLLRLGKSAASRRVGRLASVDVTGGVPRKARIRLNRKARNAMRRARLVRLVLTARAADGAGRAAAPVRKTVRLRAR